MSTPQGNYNQYPPQNQPQTPQNYNQFSNPPQNYNQYPDNNYGNNYTQGNQNESGYNSIQ